MLSFKNKLYKKVFTEEYFFKLIQEINLNFFKENQLCNCILLLLLLFNFFLNCLKFYLNHSRPILWL